MQGRRVCQSILIVLALFLAACATSGRHAAVNAVDGGAQGGLTLPLDYLPALRGDYFETEVAATGRRYHSYVRFPEGYDPAAARRYPVVYLLDGDSLYPLLAPTHLFLVYDEQLPEAIVVGIAYGGFDPASNKRHIDFSAPAPDAKAGEEGAPAFLEFLAEQLIPEVERKYRADPGKRILLGQSRGGSFVLWSALEAPDLFWGRIASNPGLGSASARFFASAAPHEREDLRVAVVSGTRDTQERQQHAKAWSGFWRGRPGAPWEVELFVLPGGTHAASVGEAYRRTMLWLFREDIAAARAKQ